MAKNIVTNPINLNKPKAPKVKGKPKKSRKSEKQIALEKEFKRQQKRALALISRREAKGFVVNPKLKESVMKTPKRITAKSVDRLSAVNSGAVYKKSKKIVIVNGKAKNLRGDLAQKEIRKQQAAIRAAKNLQNKLTDLASGKEVKPVRVARFKNPNGRGKKVLTKLPKIKAPATKYDVSFDNVDVPYWRKGDQNTVGFDSMAINYLEADMNVLREIPARPFQSFYLNLEKAIDKWGIEGVARWYWGMNPPNINDKMYYQDFMKIAPDYLRTFLEKGFIWVQDEKEAKEYESEMRRMIKEFEEDQNNDAGFYELQEPFSINNTPELKSDYQKLKKRNKSTIIREVDDDEEGWL